MSMRDEGSVDIYGLMEASRIGERLKGYIMDCVRFHTFPAAGLILGVFMVDLALEKLGAKPGDRLYAVSESPKCLPDAVQVITHCTYGNHRLRVIDTGRFSIALNRFSEGRTAPGVRVFIDAKKVAAYPTLYAWYTNDYNGGADGKALLEEILKAGRSVLSWEYVNVRFTPKEKWRPVKCPSCGELVPENRLENGVCRACGSMAYYEREMKASGQLLN
ncbi:FmdE family protein [Methanocella conradii]|uniref:FmdE family protein n=1 Tax=Methanocella conradii TaxID=1175444 RepID=UPI0020C69D0C|nr:FmdE family protein [Methanocella conradii]